MFLSLNWLKDFVDIPKGISNQELGSKITLHTAEVEGVVDMKKALEGVVVGEIKKIEKHPDADRLSVAQVDIGKKTIQLIFGQMAEMHVGFRVPVAVAPTTLPTGLEILPKKIRGVETHGMLCLDQELGLKQEGVSIHFFDEDTKPGTPAAKAIGIDDIIIEIDNKSLTHRPDLWGHYGMAREVAAIFHTKLKEPKNFLYEKKASKSPVTVDIRDKEGCTRYCIAVMNGIKIGPSPKWLQQRLEACGQKSINNIVDATNYVMMEVGHPLHAFDRAEIDGKIIVRRAKNKEKLVRLDGEEDTLDDSMLIIADEKKALALAGIKGGLHSGINENTSEIVIECAHFHPTLVRKTSQKLGIRTDALQRFEKSLDPKGAEIAIKRCVQLITEICEGSDVEGITIDEWKEPKISVTITPEEICSKIGKHIPTKEIIDILTRLEFAVEKKKDALHINIPSFRATKDVDIKDDIVEEVARMHGYDNIEPILPSLPIKLPEENYERMRTNHAKEILSTGLGMDEVYTYSFYGKKEIETCMLGDTKHVFLENYLSEDQTHMRASLIPTLLKAAQHNLKYFDHAAIYEVGRTYFPKKGKLPQEETMLSGVFVKEKKVAGEPFFEAKGTVIEFLRKFHHGEGFELCECGDTLPFAGAHVLSINIDGKTIGHIFDFHPTVLSTHKLQKAAGFELDLGTIAAMPDTPRPYRPLAKFPSAVFDVSVIVDEHVKAAEVTQAISKANDTLITEIDLFDIYRSEKHLGPNRKAIACNITLQAPDRTLEDKEVKKVQETVFKNLQKIGGEIRGL